MTDLSELLERVRSATGPDRELDAALARALGWSFTEGDGDSRFPLGLACFTASIDAALALVERCLPGWKWNIGHDANGELHATLWHGVTEHDEYAATPPLAILSALLQALGEKP